MDSAVSHLLHEVSSLMSLLLTLVSIYEIIHTLIQLSVEYLLGAQHCLALGWWRWKADGNPCLHGAGRCNSPAVQLKRPEFLPAPVSVTVMNERWVHPRAVWGCAIISWPGASRDGQRKTLRLKAAWERWSYLLGDDDDPLLSVQDFRWMNHALCILKHIPPSHLSSKSSSAASPETAALGSSSLLFTLFPNVKLPHRSTVYECVRVCVWKGSLLRQPTPH